jgi:hypothetical protein
MFEAPESGIKLTKAPKGSLFSTSVMITISVVVIVESIEGSGDIIEAFIERVDINTILAPKVVETGTDIVVAISSIDSCAGKTLIERQEEVWWYANFIIVLDLCFILDIVTVEITVVFVSSPWKLFGLIANDTRAANGAAVAPRFNEAFGAGDVLYMPACAGNVR